MYSRVLYIVIIQLLISLACGQVLFEENFSELTAAGASAKAKVLQGSLDYPFHGEKGHHLLIRDDDAGVVYKVNESFSNGTSYQTLYLSFCLRSLNKGTKNKFAGVILYQDGKEVLGLGNDWASENFTFWASDGNGRSIGDAAMPVDADVHKIVMRIDFNSNGPEKIRIGLDPLCRRSEARQPDHIWADYESELSFNEVRIRCGKSDCEWEFDEIRIGTDWASVTPADEKPGETIEKLTSVVVPLGKSEMIHDGVARFWSSEAKDSDVLPSFVLETPRQPTGPVVESWSLKPQFGTFQTTRFAYLDVPEDTDLYGTGEVTGRLLRNGYRITLFNKDNYGYGKPDQLYQSHPWVLGLRQNGTAFGVIFDTTWRAELDLRAGILFTTPAEAPAFPVIIIEGKDPQDVMIKLSALSGRMPMPPRWALGYHQCRYSYNPEARVREIADTFRAKRIPCDVIWLDIDYMDKYRIFTFDPNQFPDPKGLNDYLHASGFKSVWMIDPGVKHEPGYSIYDSGTLADVWVKDVSGKPFVGPVWPGDCVFPDFTIPSVRVWWSGPYAGFMSLGIDGIWNDMNEPAVFKEETGWTMLPDCQHRGGEGLPPGPHVQYHNVYGMLMVKASREGIQKASPDKRPFVLSRANYLGGHRYAATWTGDNKSNWQHLKWSIPMSLNLSLSGQPFNGPDIGGFVGDASPELWAHWISVGAFYPFSRAHAEKGSNNKEPWALGPETEKAARAALQRRYRLMPYLYTVFRQSHRTGLPIMQPFFFADPADLSLRMEDRAFLIGQDLMVIPKWATAISMPKGVWQSVSIVDENGTENQYQCDLKIRGGAIIPLGPVIQTTEEIQDLQPLTLMVVLNQEGTAEGTLYEDSGEGYGYLNGEYGLSAFEAQKEGDCVFVKCVQQEGQWSRQKRLVSVAVVNERGIDYGFGDIYGGVKVLLGEKTEGIVEAASIR